MPQVLLECPSWPQQETEIPLTQETFRSSFGGCISFQSSLNDVSERHDDYLPAIHHSVSCDSSKKLAKSCLQPHSTLYDEAATSAPPAYNTPPRPNRQADQVPQNPFCVGNIKKRLLNVSNPPNASSQPMSCEAFHANTTKHLPDTFTNIRSAQC